jgi:hypothetical protein
VVLLVKLLVLVIRVKIPVRLAVTGLEDPVLLLRVIHVGAAILVMVVLLVMAWIHVRLPAIPMAVLAILHHVSTQNIPKKLVLV